MNTIDFSRKWPSALILAMALATLRPSLAYGQYAVDWFTIDGGGGTSSGGAFSVCGTIGQPDAGEMTGGAFTLKGGFWAAGIVELPTLSIEKNGDSLVMSWSPATPGFQLESTGDLVGAVWTAAPVGNPVTIPITGSASYFRLRRD